MDISYLVSFFSNASSPSRTVLAVIAIMVGALIAFFLVRWILIHVIHVALSKTRNAWDDVLIHNRVLLPLAYMAPALVIYYGGHLFPGASGMVERLVATLIFINILVVVDRLLSAGLEIYNRFPVSKKRPIKGYVQILKIFLYIFGGIVAICMLTGQSPWVFLSGLGALTAVLLFVFKDTLLSFVASLQIAANDLVRVGDWIEMPKYGADGDVIEMALHTVKVQNWDKTITTIPTYKLIEDSFKNWRGMTEAGGRRIKRSLLIDQFSVRFCDADMIGRFEKIQILRDYIQRKRKELERYNRDHGIDPDQVVNGRRMTNLGTFRAYLVEYLRRHPKIRQDMTFLVRQLDPTPDGIPLEIYVFTNDVKWANYESIQADIFDHILAAIPEFGLRVYQRPSGHDLVALMERGWNLTEEGIS